MGKRDLLTRLPQKCREIITTGKALFQLPNDEAKEVYTKLDKERMEIRVLDVQGDMIDAPLACQLRTVSLLDDPLPKYEAVSYCWAEVVGFDQMSLNGIEVTVPASSANVIRQFRPPSGMRTLWCDAVCINQADIEERSEQVSIMDHVYRGTLRTLIWLGNSDDKTERTFRTIESMAEIARANEQIPDMPNLPAELVPASIQAADMEDVHEMLRRPWFGRVWVLQEASLPSEAVCHCGRLSIPWADVYMIASWWLEARNKIRSSGAESDRTPPYAGLNMCESGRAMVVVHRIFHNAPYTTGTYGSQLKNTRGLDASNRRDKCYAIRGIVWSIPKGLDLMPDWARVDYNKSTMRVLRDATKLAIWQFGNLDVLQRIDNLPLDTEKRDPIEQIESPSWVPRWDRNTAINDRGLDLSGIKCGGKDVACTSEKADQTLIGHTGDEPFLPLRGFEIDRVASYGRHRPQGGVGAVLQEFVIVTRRLIDQEAANHALDDSDVNRMRDEAMNALSCGNLTYWLPDSQERSRFIAGVERLFDYPLFGPKIGIWREERLARVFHDFWNTWGDYSRYSCPFITQSRRFGMGPMGIQANDCVVALFGSKIPYILRAYPVVPTADPETPLKYQLLGPCYLQGVMFGEGVQAMREEGRKPTTFELW